MPSTTPTASAETTSNEPAGDERRAQRSQCKDDAQDAHMTEAKNYLAAGRRSSPLPRDLL